MHRGASLGLLSNQLAAAGRQQAIGKQFLWALGLGSLCSCGLDRILTSSLSDGFLLHGGSQAKKQQIATGTTRKTWKSYRLMETNTNPLTSKSTVRDAGEAQNASSFQGFPKPALPKNIPKRGKARPRVAFQALGLTSSTTHLVTTRRYRLKKDTAKSTGCGQRRNTARWQVWCVPSADMTA